jgi:ribosome-binding protein aMBF1 (putative translation factor)
MSDLEKYVNKRKERDTEFADGYDVGYEAFKFGAIIKELRLENGMTQEDLAKKLHTRKTVVSRLENYPADIRLATLAKAADVFGKKVKIGIM